MQEGVIPEESVQNLNEPLIPGLTEESAQSGETATAATERTETSVQADAQSSGSSQRIRRPPIKTAYGNVGQPNDYWGSINTISASAPNYIHPTNPFSTTFPTFPMHPTNPFSTTFPRSQCIQQTRFLQNPQWSQPPRCSRYPYGPQYSQRHHSFHQYLRLTGGIVTVQR